MLNSLEDLWFLIFIILIIMGICVIVGINYFWGLTWNIHNGESFCINNKYSIWKILWWNNLAFFCDNKVKSKCIGWIRKYYSYVQNASATITFHLTIVEFCLKGQEPNKWYIKGRQ